MSLGPVARVMVAAALAIAASMPADAAGPLDPLAAARNFDLAIGDDVIAADTGSVVASPGKTLQIRALAATPAPDFALYAGPALAVAAAGPRRWRIRVGQAPGVHRLTVLNRATGRQLPVNIFVAQPYDATQQRIDGYRIGHYQATPRHRNPIYDPPAALLRVGPGDVDARLAPDFTIGQFLCHQQPEHWPKFALVRPRLVDKLEAILAALRRQGIDADTLTVMSGYRTPQYNARIGNTTVYSRHLYGGAADIYVDTNHDDEMDDLNGDGVIDRRDAEWLAQRVASVDAAHPRFAGGLSAYPANRYHGPFVHVDVRGTPVRW